MNSPKKIIKIGIDLHGVINTRPEFYAILTNTLVDAGHEVHILTGSEYSESIAEELRGYGVKWTHFFSITDYNRAIGTPVTYDENGQPWMDKDKWMRSKGEYCRFHNLDLCIDDTIAYGEFFTTPFARFFSKHVSLHVEEIKEKSDYVPEAEVHPSAKHFLDHITDHGFAIEPDE